MKNKLKILEVNNIDLPGQRFNGYDIMLHINKNTNHSAKQIVTYKWSNNKDVIQFFKSPKNIRFNENLIMEESNILSVHSQLSITSPALKRNKQFQKADLVHYHLIHNTKLSLKSLESLIAEKPSIISIHDPWIFTGRCVQPQDCEGWKTGCKSCEYLDTPFPLKEDNCKYLWNIKEEVYKQLDADIIVSTQFMYDMLKESPLTKHFKNVHLLPFGIDLDFFSNRIPKEKAREKFSIPKDDTVLFFRAQQEFKGVNYIIEALKILDTKKRITILTCDNMGYLDSIKHKYNVIEYGHIDSEMMINAYNACDVFLMPSIGESFGLMAVEAMACEKPVIIFDNTALPSVTFAPECGVLVENKNVIKLAEAIKWMVEDKKERTTRGKLARKLAEKHYDQEDYHKRIIEIYEKAYNRQLHKKNPGIFYDIDYSNINIQRLIPKLKIIMANLFSAPLPKIHVLENSSTIEAQNFDEIDYADRSVQNLIMQFNEELYDIAYKNDHIIARSIYKVGKIKNLALNDRRELKHQAAKRLRKYPFIFNPLKLIFIIMRKGRNFLMRGKRLRQQISYLREKNNVINEQNEIIHGKISNILSEINLVEEKIKNQENTIKYLNRSISNEQKQIFYYHGGSGNHGCEALVRTIININDFKREENCLYSYGIEEDYKFSIDEMVKYIKPSTLDSSEIDGDYFYKGAIALSIGGDNYCGYPYGTTRLALYNKKFNDRGVITALVGCSIEPDIIMHKEIQDDLNRFSLITARETITYNALLEAGIDRNTYLIPDSAFVLESIELPLPAGFEENNTVGLNISNLVQSYDKEENITYENYKTLIDYIIENTKYQIALIPHVIQEHNDDWEVLYKLYNEYKDSLRVIIIYEHNASEIKGFISRCKMFIGARTHSTIAAYSSKVPTLVLGYSVKSRGIAKDIFGCENNYVLPVQFLKTKNDLTNAFKWLDKNNEKIRKHLEEFIPSYVEKCYELKKVISDVRKKGKSLKALASHEDCSGCSACANVCPVNCIEMLADEEGFLRPVTNYKKCINCELCREICPINNYNHININIKTYAAKNKNLEIRLDSSSGGVFTAFAERTIKKNGIVFGASYDDQNDVVQTEVNTLETLKRLRSSKYVQSDVKDTYCLVKKHLNKKREVLYSGTPCQIQGLYAYLGKDYKNLLTIEVICHGTPSPEVFRRYREELETKFESKITNINFRSKESGWKKYSNRYVFKNGTVFSEDSHTNIYMRAFLNNLDLRPSCHRCKANNFRSGSDIALADFWGIEKVLADFDDDNGVSLVIIKTSKGAKALADLKDKFIIEEVNSEEAIKYNYCITSSVLPHENRDKFFKEFQKNKVSLSIKDNLE